MDRFNPDTPSLEGRLTPLYELLDPAYGYYEPKDAEDFRTVAIAQVQLAIASFTNFSTEEKRNHIAQQQRVVEPPTSTQTDFLRFLTKEEMDFQAAEEHQSLLYQEEDLFLTLKAYGMSTPLGLGRIFNNPYTQYPPNLPAIFVELGIEPEITGPYMLHSAVQSELIKIGVPRSFLDELSLRQQKNLNTHAERLVALTNKGVPIATLLALDFLLLEEILTAPEECFLEYFYWQGIAGLIRPNILPDFTRIIELEPPLRSLVIRKSGYIAELAKKGFHLPHFLQLAQCLRNYFLETICDPYDRSLFDQLPHRIIGKNIPDRTLANAIRRVQDLQQKPAKRNPALSSSGYDTDTLST